MGIMGWWARFWEPYEVLWFCKNCNFFRLASKKPDNFEVWYDRCTQDTYYTHKLCGCIATRWKEIE